LSRNKFEFNACDWLSRSATNQKHAYKADGEGEPEFEVDQSLSESHNFVLYKDLAGYHSLWDTSFVPSKQAGKKAKGLEELSQKYNFSPSYLKRN